MDGPEYVKSPPTLKLLKQLDVPLAIAQKTSSWFGAIQDSVAAVATMNIPHDRWMRDMSEVTTSLRNGLQTWGLQQTEVEKIVESLKRNVAAEATSMVAGWETSFDDSAFEYSPTQRVLLAMKRDWDPIAIAMKSARDKWAVEADSFARIAGSWLQDLTRESESLATTWQSVQATRALDTTRFLRTFELPRMPKISLDPVWAPPVFLETLEPPRVNQIASNNILSRRPFRNYRMAESYDLLSDFEKDLRTFIHQRMSEAFGQNWGKSRVRREIFKIWLDKRAKAKLAGESSNLLIDYADFTDYVEIITRNDNWEELFKLYFRRKQLVQESLYRLQPIRVCIMHSRILSREMWLILRAETMLLSERMWN